MKGVKYFENCLTWNIDGSIGKAFRRKGKFSLSEKVIPLILKKEYLGKIDYDFIKYELEKEALRMGFSFSNKAGKTKIGDIEIQFQCKEIDGKDYPDLEKQKEIAEKYKKIDKVKKGLKNIFLDLEEIKIAVSKNDVGKNQLISLGEADYFYVDNGARVTKKEIQSAKGEIPFYSSSKFENQMMGRVSDEIKNIVKDAKFFEGTNITINADGSVGAIFLRKGKFYANDVCNVIKIKDKKIDPSFIKFELRTEIYKRGLSWSNKLYKKKLKEIEVRIPLKEGGVFDLQKQIKLGKKYQKIEEVREKLLNELKEISQVKVEL